MAEFLLELLSEEIPARMQARAAQDLAERFTAACTARGLAAGHVAAHVTPRRLALLATGLPEATQPTREERRGPRADAPEGAIAGFCRSAGVAREALVARDDPKGRFLYAIIETPGRPAAEVLAEAAREAVEGLAWPKSMRWGAASVEMDSPRWVRPLERVVALLDGAVVPLTLMGVEAGRATRGHRFMGPPGPVEIERPGTYADQLRAAHVILDAGERAAIIRQRARRAAEAAGLALVEDEALVAENAGLTEWPVPLIGRFDPAFLAVPPEIIRLTMKVNQKYFALRTPDGALAPAFVCVANLEAPDGGAAIVAGNERVLAARLADARFFWEQDVAAWRQAAAAGPDGLWAAFRPRLERLTFHEKLGSMADKAERVGRLARRLAESGAVRGADPDLAERAGRLAKADLVSATVGEFPELQGVIGGRLAAAAGEPEAVVTTLRQHYVPVAEGSVPVAVALADRIDTLAGFFGIGAAPTGSRDPFALRRAGLSIIGMIIDGRLSLSIRRLIYEAVLENAIYRFANISREQEASLLRAITDRFGESPGRSVVTFGPDSLEPSPIQSDLIRNVGAIIEDVKQFLIDRLKVQQREAGVRHDLIEAAFATGDDNLVRLVARTRALQSFLATDDGANLLAAYRRAASILADEERKDGHAHALDPAAPLSRYVGETEQALARLFHAAEGSGATLLPDEIDALLAREDFGGAMRALATLRAPVDAFFERLMVNDPDPATRQRRLELLAGVRAAMHKVADFSRIEG